MTIRVKDMFQWLILKDDGNSLGWFLISIYSEIIRRNFAWFVHFHKIQIPY